MTESPTILRAFDDYDQNAYNKAMYLGPVNNRTFYAPASTIHYCDNGDIWLGKGWYARRKPTRKCQVRVTPVNGRISVTMPWTEFMKMGYSHCLNVNETWKVGDFRFITSW